MLLVMGTHYFRSVLHTEWPVCVRELKLIEHCMFDRLMVCKRGRDRSAHDTATHMAVGRPSPVCLIVGLDVRAVQVH